MTSRPPTSDEQIAFLANIQLLLDEGQFVASYKFALLIALADLAIESEVDDGRELEIPIEKIAEKFVAYYWRQAAPWSPAGRAKDAVVLRQNAGKQAEVLTRVFEVRERVSAYEVEVRRNSREWRSLIAKVKHVVAVMPLWKLQTLKGRKLEFLYENRERGTAIVLKPGVAFNLRQFHPLVTGLARSAWAQFVRQLGANHDVLGQAVDLEEFLFGTPRADLSDYRTILGPLQKDQCFYCDARLRGRGAVDHFVPWRRYPVDLAHNFVLADDGCNSRKSDLLADVPFLERWLRRNEDAKDELTASFIARHLPFDFDVSRQVTRWAYAQVEHTGGQVWAPETTYKSLGGEWRSVFDLSRSSP